MKLLDWAEWDLAVLSEVTSWKYGQIW